MELYENIKRFNLGTDDLEADWYISARLVELKLAELVEPLYIDWEKVWSQYHKYKHHLDADNPKDRKAIQNLIERALKEEL